jgi:hypothetical protein
LVWGEKGTEGENLVFNKFIPESGAFVEIEFKKIGAAGCILNGEKVVVEGSVLGWVPVLNKEAIINATLFEVNNPSGTEVVQRDTKWEVQQEGGGRETGVAEVTLKLGTVTSKFAIESIDQFEKPFGIREGKNRRGLFGVRTN